MPIGKNSIKRVKNGGYSNVKTTAPDMENSTVIANPSPEVVEKMISSPKAKRKAPAAKSTKKEAAEKKTGVKTATASKGSAKSVKAAEERDGFIRISLGCDLPEYLL